MSNDEDDDEDVEIVPTPGVFWVASQPKFAAWPYIVVNKERRMDGPIQEVDVVRPINHMYTVKGVDNPIEWKRKSSMRCPTYGNCVSCLRSGPVGMACGFCNEKSAGYKCLYIFQYGGRQWIDAQWFAEKLFRNGHVTVMANRRVGWLTTPIASFNIDALYLWVNRFYPREDGVSEEERDLKKKEYRIELFKELEKGWSPEDD
jgi:hypothetical protein